MCLSSTRCTREESKKVQHKFNGKKYKLANTQTSKRVLSPIMKTITKNIKFGFKPPKGKKLNTL